MTSNKPLCVDLDGTLTKTDLLLETFILLIKKNPFMLLMLPLWLMKGKAFLKNEIARRVDFNEMTLPYNKEFVAWLLTEKNSGRDIYLCTASNQKIADKIGRYFGFFSDAIGSCQSINLSGKRKRDELVKRFGFKGFDYCGNSNDDIEVWKASRNAIVVNASSRVLKCAKSIAEVSLVFDAKARTLEMFAKSLRLHQWAKNVLVFVPLVTSHKVGDLGSVEAALMAFLAFSLCASSVYVLNDLLDLESDRKHHRKSRRPFASGDFPVSVGLVLLPSLIGSSIYLSFVLPPMFWITLVSYYVLTCLYSFWLKKVMIVDTIVLACLYTVRVIAGGFAIAAEASFWLLLFSVFIFFSLAFVKRYAELHSMKLKGILSAEGRGYHVEDLPLLQSIGGASGYLSVLVLGLYINNPEVSSLYKQPYLIWFVCVLMMFWISWVWMIAHRGKMNEDPVVFALKDKVSICVGILTATVLFMAT